jgi:predicted alpha/beta superfamily hydrolase
MKNTVVYILLFLISTASFGQSTSTEIIEFKSKIFDGTRKIRVNIPDDYAQYPNRNYKVVYFFDAQAESFYNFTYESLKYMYNGINIYIEPVIFVGIMTSNRQFEFTPKNKTRQPLKDYWENVKLGGADSLAISLRDEVFPLIKSKFRCDGYNVAMGHSLGGSFVTFTLTKYPELFNAIIAVSPNYYYDNEQLLNTFDSLATSKLLNKKFLYIAYGKGDKLEERFRHSTMKFNSILKKKNLMGVNWSVKSLDNDSHGTTPMEGFFKGFNEFSKALTVDDEQAETFVKDKSKPYLDNLKSYYGKQTIATGIKLPAINDVNRLAYNSFYANKKAEAIQILEWGVYLYPDDANLFDSLGEIQQDLGNINEAKKSYVKGMNIIESQKSLLSEAIYKDKSSWFSERIKSTEQKK